MLNFSFAFGQDIAHQAVRLGNSELRAAYAVWPIGLAGGFLPNIAYSLYLLRRNRSWTAFMPASPDALLPVLMGVLWMGAFALYGMSAAFLGSLGTSIGWGLMQSFMIMTATLSGVWTGEWKGASRTSRTLLVSGLVCSDLCHGASRNGKPIEGQLGLPCQGGGLDGNAQLFPRPSAKFHIPGTKIIDQRDPFVVLLAPHVLKNRIENEPFDIDIGTSCAPYT